MSGRRDFKCKTKSPLHESCLLQHIHTRHVNDVVGILVLVLVQEVSRRPTQVLSEVGRLAIVLNLQS